MLLFPHPPFPHTIIFIIIPLNNNFYKETTFIDFIIIVNYSKQKQMFSFIDVEPTQTIFFIEKDFRTNNINSLHICHKKYSVWALALKAIRL